ncbi:DUF309 domain-containing protein [Thermoflavimicrobium dichotomicum]|nr:DUF309 domain-containing protein [Thermoflavimicrobium dichotomicum]
MYSELYVDFLYYFNKKQDYYECHEVLEELWLEEGREIFYQGLLQIAVGLYHFQNDNLGGAKKMFQSALSKLMEYPAEWMGIDVKSLRQDAQDYLSRLQAFENQPFSFVPLYIKIVDPLLKKWVEQKS